jgi:catechol 2,3-dioxygenase-like lactoylglutathione lyase family enzyme
MLDHIGFSVADYARSRAFYDAALAPLGVARQMEVTKAETGGYEGAGYGSAGKPQLHVAFTAASRAEVDAFYTAAMAAGATDNGPPGLRAHYHPTYYAAFVLDPDGHNIEAVCHAPA